METTNENGKIYTEEEYKADLETVYNFHKNCYETVKDCLEKHGDIDITQSDDKEDWYFDFIGQDSTLEVQAIRLCGDIFLECSEFGFGYEGKHYISWEEINHDMTIIEMIMGKVFEINSKE